MSTLYLHIGMPKTGTSYIQKFLKVNKEVIKTKGYVFPLTLKMPNVLSQRNGRFLVHTFYDEKGKPDKSKFLEVWNKSFDVISKWFETHDNVILSEESIWNLSKSNDAFWKRLKKELKRRNIDCKVVVYLRRQDLFIQSHWAQKVQDSHEFTLKEYLNKKHSGRLDYYTRLEEIAKFMGKENMIVRIYEKQQWKNNSLVADFFDAVGLELTDEYALPEKSVVNISLNGKYLEFKRYMNRFPERRAQNKKKDHLYYLLSKLQEESSTGTNYKKNVYLSHKEATDFLSRYDEENSKVACDYLGRSDGVLFRDEIVCDEEEKEAYTLEELLEVANEVFTIQAKIDEERKQKVIELRKLVKQQQSTIDWISASFPTKVKRKLKRIFKGIFNFKKSNTDK